MLCMNPRKTIIAILVTLSTFLALAHDLCANMEGFLAQPTRPTPTPRPRPTYCNEQVTEVISASQGGTIRLPSGSKVFIPPGALPSDQLVTLTLSCSMARQPPNGLIIGVG